ncbi:MAG: hypothetical protein ACTH2Q_21540 [Propionibacteriaceae bacterium]
MVGILTSMKFAMLRHSPSGLRVAGWFHGAALVVATWAAGFSATDDAVRSDVLMLVFVLWGVGCILGPVTISGAGVLRTEYFSLLPVARSRLALGLLGAVFPGVASGYLLLALIVLTALLLAAAARTLRPNLGSRRTRPQRRPSTRGLDGRSLLPDTPLGVVVGKELRQWRRDPWRRLELRTSMYTGLLTGLFVLSAPEAPPTRHSPARSVHS